MLEPGPKYLRLGKTDRLGRTNLVNSPFRPIDGDGVSRHRLWRRKSDCRQEYRGFGRHSRPCARKRKWKGEWKRPGSRSCKRAKLRELGPPDLIATGAGATPKPIAQVNAANAAFTSYAKHAIRTQRISNSETLGC